MEGVLTRSETSDSIVWAAIEYEPCQNGHIWIWSDCSTAYDPGSLLCECGKYRWDDKIIEWL